MTSAEFLTFYALACVLVLALAGWFVRNADDSAAAGRESLPSDFDPQEIAFLRGGKNELVRFAVFDLTYKELLQLGPAEKRRDPPIQRTEKAPGSSLDPIESIVYGFFDQPQTARALFASDTPEQVEKAFAPREERLKARRLLTDDAVFAAAKTARIVAFLTIAGLCAWRVSYALSLHHRNIGFTLLIALFASLALLFVTRVPRLSKRGRAYVQTLRAALPAAPPALPMGSAFAPAASVFPVVVAAGGMALLAGTPYAGLSQTFRRAAAGDSASGCGSGGGGDSSSSCSSGGGCGGGGCGGGS
jgi:uncharacterized protein (TIGR04222 family)